MSKPGQYTFTGISDQADIALLYLLRATKRSDFQRIIVEGREWEDFTLVFDERNEDYEVKSYKEPIGYSVIKKIIAKELTKQLGEKDVLKIVVRQLNQKFKDSFEYVHDYLLWIKLKPLSKNHIVKQFLNKGWSKEQIFFLPKVQIIEFGKIINIHKQISEFFALEDPFYLNQNDQESLVGQSFRKIMHKGKKGGSIERKEFLNILDTFKKNMVEKSESFSPDKALGEKVGKIRKFLSSKKSLDILLQPKYLTPISSNRRLIFYLADKLEQSRFHINSFRSFIDDILLKQDYAMLTFRILEKKRLQKKIDDEYLLDFLINNYKKLFYEFNYDDALKIIREIVEKDKQGLFVNRVLDFLKNEILLPFKKEIKIRREKKKRGWREDEHIAKILKIFFERSKNKRKFMDFIFEYFDFTSDDFENVIETHPLIYDIAKEFIKEDFENNFYYIVKRISAQFNYRYNNKYDGYEWTGSGISQAGSSYSIEDKGVVRLLFYPLFLEFYNKNQKEAWRFFKEKILKKAKKGATSNNPVYLKRALTPLLLGRLQNNDLTGKDRETTFKYLKNILWIKKGIPCTSEVIFSELRGKDLKKIGFNKIMQLIDIDSLKYKRKNYPAGYPTNLFVISILVSLIKLGYKPAKDFYLSLLKRPEFIKRDRYYDTFEQIVSQGLPDSDPNFIVEIFNNIDFEKYLDSFEKDIVWDKSGLISGLIKKDWQNNTIKGQQIITTLLRNKPPSKKVLEFLAGPIRDLSQHNAIKTYNLLSPYLRNKNIFWKTFQNNSYARESIVSMAEDLVKTKNYDEAKHIIDLCIDDPDPETDEKSEFNYHLKIKNGEKESLISSVRGKLAWVIQKFVITNEPNLMEYAFAKTKILLDLDGMLAKKLNYSEPDLYVRQQALVPFIELSHPGRRRLLSRQLNDSIKATAFEILRIMNEQIKSKNANPISLNEHLVHVFSYIRDVSTDEAKEILAFFEDNKISEAHFLFVYFAVYRKEQFKEIPFDPKYFEEKLVYLCQNDDQFRKSLAWEFWRTAEDDKKNKTKHFDNIEKYWKLLFEKYDQQTFDDLYRTLEITLNDSAKYAEHKGLLKEALKKETDYLKTNKIQAQLWEPGREIFQILKNHSDDDFLDVFGHLVENLNENIYYFWIKDWIRMFNSIKPVTPIQKKSSRKVKSVLKNLYPEYLESEKLNPA